MLRRDHLKGLGVGAVFCTGLYGYQFYDENGEDDGTKPPHERNFNDLQDGDWHSNVEFDSPIEELTLEIFEAGSMPQGSMQSTIEIDGGFEYRGSDTIAIYLMKLDWMMGDSAIVDDATVEFDRGLVLSNEESCPQPPHYNFEIDVTVSSIQSADKLVITVPQEDVSTSDC